MNEELAAAVRELLHSGLTIRDVAIMIGAHERAVVALILAPSVWR